MFDPTEAVPTGPVVAPLPAPLVQHRLQDWHTVQQNYVTQHGVFLFKMKMLQNQVYYRIVIT